MFVQRMLQGGLLQEDVDRAVAAHIDTLGALAYSSSYIPGHSDDAPFQAVVTKILGENGVARAPLLRRIYYESYTLSTAEIRRKAERSDDAAPMKMPEAERANRYRAQVQKLPGLSLVGELEPSHALCDKYFNMLEDGVVRFVPWSEYTKREQEIEGIKVVRDLVTVNDGVLKLAKREDKASSADMSDNLMVKYALMRRGLAMDQVGILAYDIHDSLINAYFHELVRDAPEGYRRPSLDQVYRADRELWKRLAEQLRDGVRPSAAGVRPLDAIFMGTYQSIGIQMLLAPLPIKGEKTDRKRTLDDDEPEQPFSGISKSAKQRARKQRAQDSAVQAAVAKATANIVAAPIRLAAAAASGQTSGVRMPKELIGFASKTNDSPPKFLCFAFNMTVGCTQASNGERCPKGWHLCCRCFGPHSLRNCTSEGRR